MVPGFGCLMGGSFLSLTKRQKKQRVQGFKDDFFLSRWIQTILSHPKSLSRRISVFVASCVFFVGCWVVASGVQQEILQINLINILQMAEF